MSSFGLVMLPPKRSTRSSASPTVITRSTRTNVFQEHEHTQSQSETNQIDLLLPDDTQPELEAGDAASFLTKFKLKQVIQGQGSTDSESDLTPARKKERRKLTTPQRRALENLAALESNPSLESRRALADELGLELKIVSVWFQNRRRPTTKLKARASVETGQSSSPSALTKLDSGRREILRDVSASAGGTNTPRFSNSFPSNSCTAIHAHGRSFSGLWTLLPSSPPMSLGQHHDSGQLSDSSFPTSSPKTERRISLEWACKHERRTVKRARTSLIHNVSEPLVQQNESLPQRRSRRRTDIKPRRPSLCLRQTTFVRRTSTLGSRPYQISREKDILDVAIALIQLKAQRLPSSSESIMS